MKRHFYISDDLKDLQQIEQELMSNGLSTPQMHILSDNDAEVENHQLHEVEAVLKKDVVHSMEMGAVVGIICSALVLTAAYLAGWTDTAAGWMPFIFLSIVVLGFCTWEGGLFGIQEPHYQFKRFQQFLKEGKHVFFVDVDTQQEPILARIVQSHPTLELAGMGEAKNGIVIEAQNRWHGFVKSMP